MAADAFGAHSAWLRKRTNEAAATGRERSFMDDGVMKEGEASVVEVASLTLR